MSSRFHMIEMGKIYSLCIVAMVRRNAAVT